MDATRPRGRPANAFGAANLWISYLALGAVVCALPVVVVPPNGSAADWLAGGLGLYGVLGIVAGIRLHRPRPGPAWWLFAAGLTLLCAGAAGPLRLAANPLRLAAYPLLIGGLVVLVGQRNRRPDGHVDALIVSLGLSLVAGVVLVAPLLDDGTLALAPKLVSVGCLAGDIVLMVAGVALALDAGRRRPVLALLIVAIATLLATDFVHGIVMLHGAGGAARPWLSAGRIMVGALWGAAALHPSMPELSEAEAEAAAGSDRAGPLSRRRLTWLAGATLIAPVLEMAKIVPTGNWDLLAIVVASIVLLGVVAGRIWGLVRAGEKSVGRERSLTAATGLLVAATAPQEIVIAALQAIAEIGQEQLDARLCRVTGDAVQILALGDNGGLQEWTARHEVAALLEGAANGQTIGLPVAARAELRVCGGVSRALALELRAGAELLVLLVSGAAAEDHATGYALRTLAHQVALALGSAELAEEVHRQEGEARFSTLVQNSSDLITVLAADNTILYQSPSIERVLGFRPDEVVGCTVGVLLHPDEQGRMLRRLSDGAGAAGRPEVIECLLRHRDGGLRHFEIFHTNLLEDAAVGGIVLNGRDVSERKAFEEQLTHQAFHDPVTALANRALFHERVRHAVARARREGTSMAVLFVDLDDFKTVNDSLGHAAGDVVLQEVAKRIASSIRAADTAARFGGDEFTILLEEVADVRIAAETAERVLDELARPIAVQQTDIVVGASVGISVSEADSPSGADELIRNADAAMYIAKSDGKGGYRLFQSTMHDQVVARLQLRAALQQAIMRDEFALYFQPLVRLQDGVVTGFEALLRWIHPERGIVAPDQFIPFAEETGLIVEIGRWVLQEGCRQAVAFRGAVPGDVKPKIGINLSVKQLFDADIVGDVAQALADSGLPPQALTLEITESVMMSDIELGVERLHELRALGVRLAMDDFGTGYSSLSYLSRFPLDILKMDRSLLAAGASPMTSGLASVVVGLGETFALEVVAEGIEYREQSQTLRDLGCETGQGFYFARPMPADALLRYIDERTVRPHVVGAGR